MLFNHRQALIDQLDRECEAAMALHLASVILFQYHTNALLHAPGKMVPQIIMYLQKYLSVDDFVTLTEYHSFVVQQLKNKTKKMSDDDCADSNEPDRSVDVVLSEKLGDIKQIVKNMKKSASHVE